MAQDRANGRADCCAAEATPDSEFVLLSTLVLVTLGLGNDRDTRGGTGAGTQYPSYQRA